MLLAFSTASSFGPARDELHGDRREGGGRRRGRCDVVGALGAALVTWAQRATHGDDLYRVYRRRLGRAILPGLELLVAADIIRTVALRPTFSEDRQLLVHVMRVLRDREALAGSDEGFADLRAGRVVPLTDDLRSEIAQLRRREQPRSKST